MRALASPAGRANTSLVSVASRAAGRTTPRRPRAARSRVRARVSRDSTVPTGSPRSRAASAAARPSRQHRTNGTRRSGSRSTSSSSSRRTSRQPATVAGSECREQVSVVQRPVAGVPAGLPRPGARSAAPEGDPDSHPPTVPRRPMARLAGQDQEQAWNASSASARRGSPAGKARAPSPRAARRAVRTRPRPDS